MDNKVSIETKIPMLISDSPNVVVGQYTYGNPKLLTWTDKDRINIGSFCSIAEEVVIFGGGEHRVDWFTTYPIRIVFGLFGAGEDGHPHTKGNTEIGNDVWIGYGAKILSGVSIGSGAVIGAGSVVSKDIPPYAVAAGNPCKLIKYRFEEHIRELLLEAKWWEWPVEKIISNVHLLCGDDIDALRRVIACL